MCLRHFRIRAIGRTRKRMNWWSESSSFNKVPYYTHQTTNYITGYTLSYNTDPPLSCVPREHLYHQSCPVLPKQALFLIGAGFTYVPDTSVLYHQLIWGRTTSIILWRWKSKGRHSQSACLKSRRVENLTSHR